jgi:hypothetical protein
MKQETLKHEGLFEYKTLMLKFETAEKQNEFICELIKIPSSNDAHFSIEPEEKKCCKLLIIAANEETMAISQSKIEAIIFEVEHEKNNWFFWRRNRSK